MKKLIGIIIAASLLSGCGTIMSRHDSEYRGGTYPATQWDAKQVGQSFPVTVAAIIDMPFSLISDTIMIPADMK